MDLRQNKSLVLEFWKKWSQGAAEELGALMTDDATVEEVARSVPRTASRDQLVALVKHIKAHTRQMDMIVTGMTAERDRIAVELEGRYRFLDGREYDNLYHVLFLVRDGRVAAIREYADTLYASAVFPNGVGASGTAERTGRTK